jgi:mannitol-specific phosphotransferase system IIBC component
MNHVFDTGTKAGTVGGTVLSAGLNINAGDIPSTMILACIGAVTSFFVSLLLRHLVGKYKNRKSKK